MCIRDSGYGGRRRWVQDRMVVEGSVPLLGVGFVSSWEDLWSLGWFLLKVAKIASSLLLLLGGNPTIQSDSILSF